MSPERQIVLGTEWGSNTYNDFVMRHGLIDAGNKTAAILADYAALVVLVEKLRDDARVERFPPLVYCGRCDEDTPTTTDGKCTVCTKYKVMSEVGACICNSGFGMNLSCPVHSPYKDDALNGACPHEIVAQTIVGTNGLRTDTETRCAACGALLKSTALDTPPKMDVRGPKGFLRAGVEGGEVVIRIGVDTLAFAVGESNGIEPGTKITDKDAFAAWVAHNVVEFDLDEPGTGALGRIFDAMAVEAVEGAQDFVADPDSAPEVDVPRRELAAQRLASCRAGKHLFSSNAPYECLYCLTRGDALSNVP